MSTQIIEHGKLSSYTNHRCRCADCRRAMCEYARAYRLRHPGYQAAVQRRYKARKTAARMAVP